MKHSTSGMLKMTGQSSTLVFLHTMTRHFSTWSGMWNMRDCWESPPWLPVCGIRSSLKAQWHTGLDKVQPMNWYPVELKRSTLIKTGIELGPTLYYLACPLIWPPSCGSWSTTCSPPRRGCSVRCGENTENEFGIPVFVGKPVYIYTKTSPFIEILKKIFLPMRKWVHKFSQPPLGAEIQSSRNYMLWVL